MSCSQLQRQYRVGLQHWQQLQQVITDLHRVCGLIKVCSYNKLKTELTDEFVAHILEEHSNNVPCYATVCKFKLCIPVISVECECALSTQNRIKTKLRNRLDDDRVNTLMKLNMHWVPQMKYLTLLRQCATWKATKQRRLHFLYRPHTTNIALSLRLKSKCKRKATQHKICLTSKKPKL